MSDLFDNAGRRRASVRLENGSPVAVLYDADGAPRAAVTITEKGTPLVTLSNAGDEALAAVAILDGQAVASPLDAGGRPLRGP